MDGFPGSWLVTGGWSIDLALGHVTRDHQDIDVVVFRHPLSSVLQHFHDWNRQVVIFGEGGHRARLSPKLDVVFARLSGPSPSVDMAVAWRMDNDDILIQQFVTLVNDVTVSPSS
ncbi:hypothetical protein HIJ39_18435 [Sulfobacillus sp. DSM 109850]|uniref:Uncharacterized protein n=2 Tax=Sulfobacillus harzensis TaxID=2729629 RepID=A0A7Y0L790_9FIRM|nr:hypothetical protein [Sulfobacillus harzensis]NMP24313.1 hypothetical protein [Sulfobacillus harzensis]